MALFGKKQSAKEEKPAAKTAAPAAPAGKTSSKPSSMQDLYNGTVSESKNAGPKSSSAKAAVGASPAWLQAVLLKPVITEKATNLVSANKYAFVVSKEANKISVAKAVRALYGVKPLGVNILNRRGKKVARGKVRGERSDVKIALVTLPQGTNLKVYEGV